MQSVVVVCSYTAALFLFVKNRKLKFALYLIQLIFNKDCLWPIWEDAYLLLIPKILILRNIKETEVVMAVFLYSQCTYIVIKID